MNTDLSFITNDANQRLRRPLQSHYAEQNSAVSGKREVILSLYLAGE